MNIEAKKDLEYTKIDDKKHMKDGALNSSTWYVASMETGFMKISVLPGRKSLFKGTSQLPSDWSPQTRWIYRQQIN